MKITLAEHFGMCFGVRDALKKTQELVATAPVTILGQLVHNPVVREDLQRRGVIEADLSAIGKSATRDVVITAHGAADKDRAAWKDAGFAVTDTTCPLVKKAHTALAQLVAGGCQPIIIGQASHVEVRGLAGDFPEAVILESEADLEKLPLHTRYGIVSQTTQPSAHVRQLVGRVREKFPQAEVIWRDTVCQPTKDRQAAMEKLCRENELIIVVGGNNSNNTRQLVETARSFGVQAHQIERAADIQPEWFHGINFVGVTAGTSTLQQTVDQVVETLRFMTGEATRQAS